MNTHSQAFYAVNETFRKFDFLTLERYKTLLLLMNDIRHPALALDAGCRFGDFSLVISGMVEEVVALDLFAEEKSIGKAIANLQNSFNIHLIKADAHHLPFRHEQFDLVISSELIDYLNKPALFLRDAHRVLKKNGALLLTTPNKFTWGLMDAISFHIREVITSIKGATKPKRYHISLFTWSSLKSSLNLYKFAILREIPFERVGLCSLLHVTGRRWIKSIENTKLYRLILKKEFWLSINLPFEAHFKWAILCQKTK